MFSHTHVYFSTKLTTKEIPPYTVVGSLLPDSGLTGNINWGDIHKPEIAKNFFDQSRKKTNTSKELYEGIINHIKLDYFSHVSFKNKTGFAFAYQTPKLQKTVAKALIIDDNTKIIKTSHNFIETAVEHLLINDNPHIQLLVKNSLEKIDTVNLSNNLSTFFKTEKSKSLINLNESFTLFTKYDIRDLTECVRYWGELNYYFVKHAIDKDATKEALYIAIDIVKDKYKKFLDYTIQKHDSNEALLTLLRG